MKNIRRKLILSFFIILAAILFYAVFTIFFDQAVLVRQGTFYLANTDEKVIALTFDDGPSPEWTPQILDELKKSDVKATFFMVGKFVEKYPEIARRAVKEGHEIGNHTFSHPVLFFASPDQIKKEILQAEAAIKNATGKSTTLFRPPKAWLTEERKKEIKDLGYTIVLWTLNSKDWVTFHDKHIRRYLLKRVRSGDIILFHDSGGFFGIEGGNRIQTVKTIPRLIEQLKEGGYRFVTVGELLERDKNNGNHK